MQMTTMTIETLDNKRAT